MQLELQMPVIFWYVDTGSDSVVVTWQVPGIELFNQCSIPRPADSFMLLRLKCPPHTSIPEGDAL